MERTKLEEKERGSLSFRSVEETRIRARTVRQRPPPLPFFFEVSPGPRRPKRRAHHHCRALIPCQSSPPFHAEQPRRFPRVAAISDKAVKRGWQASLRGSGERQPRKLRRGGWRDISRALHPLLLVFSSSGTVHSLPNPSQLSLEPLSKPVPRVLKGNNTRPPVAGAPSLSQSTT